MTMLRRYDDGSRRSPRRSTTRSQRSRRLPRSRARTSRTIPSRCSGRWSSRASARERRRDRARHQRHGHADRRHRRALRVRDEPHRPDGLPRLPRRPRHRGRVAGDLLGRRTARSRSAAARGAVARRGRRPEPARCAPHARRDGISARRTWTRSTASSGRPLAGRPCAQPPPAGRRPEIDLLTNLLDRQSFTAVLERRDRPARLAGHPLSLLVARRRPAHEPQRAPRPRRRRRRAPRAREALQGDPPSRLHVPTGRGRFAVLRPEPEAGQARELYETVCADSRRARSWRGRWSRSPPAWPSSSRATTPESFAARAEAGLQQAKLERAPGTIVLESGHEVSRERSSCTPPRRRHPPGMRATRRAERRG